MTLPENYNILIMQEYTDLSVITQHINSTFIPNIKIHIYTQQLNKYTTQTHKHIHNVFYLLAVIAVLNFIKNK